MNIYFAAESVSAPPVVGWGLCVLVILIAIYAIYKGRQHDKAIENHASQQGWQRITDQNTLKSLTPPFTHNVGGRELFKHAYKAQLGEHEVLLYHYTRTLDSEGMVSYSDDLSNAAPNQTYEFAVICFTVARPFEKLLLLPRLLIVNTGLHKGLQKYNLEGDFSKYFDVYAPPDTQIETLSTLTPDVMAFIMDTVGNKFRIELDDHHVWLVSDDPRILHPKKIDNFLDKAVKLRTKLLGRR